jgi:hypothetical protein
MYGARGESSFTPYPRPVLGGGGDSKGKAPLAFTSSAKAGARRRSGSISLAAALPHLSLSGARQMLGTANDDGRGVATGAAPRLMAWLPQLRAELLSAFTNRNAHHDDASGSRPRRVNSGAPKSLGLAGHGTQPQFTGP